MIEKNVTRLDGPNFDLILSTPTSIFDLQRLNFQELVQVREPIVRTFCVSNQNVKVQRADCGKVLNADASCAWFGVDFES